MKAFAVILLAVCLAGCGYVKDTINPAHSITITLKPDTHLTKEIVSLYPDATDVKETNVADNPNYAQWDSGDMHCTAYVSATKNRYATAGSLVTAPFCLKKI